MSSKLICIRSILLAQREVYKIITLFFHNHVNSLEKFFKNIPGIITKQSIYLGLLCRNFDGLYSNCNINDIGMVLLCINLGHKNWIFIFLFSIYWCSVYVRASFVVTIVSIPRDIFSVLNKNASCANYISALAILRKSMQNAFKTVIYY